MFGRSVQKNPRLFDQIKGIALANKLTPEPRLCFSLVLASACIGVFTLECSEPALAKVQKRKLLKMEPIIDTSLVPKPSRFELQVNHTQIIYPDDPDKVLHGDSKIVDLTGEVKNDVLKGQALEEQLDSSVDTVEHDVKATFFVDLRKMAAKYAPDLNWMIESEIQSARLRSANEAERQEKLMQKELKARTPVPDIPSAQSPKNANATDLASAIAKAAAKEKNSSLNASKQLSQALDKANSDKTPDLPKLIAHAPSIPDSVSGSGPVVSIPGASGLPVSMPAIPSTNSSIVIPEVIANKVPSKQEAQKTNPLKLPLPKHGIPDLRHQLSDELVKASIKKPDTNALVAEMQKAQKKADALAKGAQTAMDMVLTSLKKIPELHFQSTKQPALAEPADTVSVVQWDKWHAHFAELAREPILKYMNSAGNPSGEDTVEITISNTQQLSARIVKPGAHEFDQSMLQAYRTLDGNADLHFPEGSRRKTITFQIDNKHMGKGAPVGVKSKTSIGDQEVLRTKR
jgi:hypothetical protein